MFAADILRHRISWMRGFRHCRWHLDEMYVNLNGEMVYLWREISRISHDIGDDSFDTSPRKEDK